MINMTYLVICQTCGGKLFALDSSADPVYGEAQAVADALGAGHHVLLVPAVMVNRVLRCDCAATAYEVDMQAMAAQ